MCNNKQLEICIIRQLKCLGAEVEKQIMADLFEINNQNQEAAEAVGTRVLALQQEHLVAVEDAVVGTTATGCEIQLNHCSMRRPRGLAWAVSGASSSGWCS